MFGFKCEFAISARKGDVTSDTPTPGVSSFYLGQEKFRCNEDCDTFGPAQFLPHRDKVVVYFQVYRYGYPARGVVPGYQASDEYVTEHGAKVIDISLIPEEERDEIKKLLATLLTGPISFWT